MSTDALTLLSWNILHGGGPTRVPEILLALVEQDADVVVLSEFRAARGGQIRAVLADHGWPHQAATATNARRNGILIASRTPLAPRPCAGFASDGRWLGVDLPDVGLTVLGVHVPDDGERAAKAGYWRRLIDHGRMCAGSATVVVGDINTGRRGQDTEGTRFSCERQLGAFCSLGYKDAWRTLNPDGREYSWVSHEGKGSRIDAAFLSPPLHGALESASYLHRHRESRASDHSPLVVSLRRSRLPSTTPRQRPTPVFAGLFGGSAS